MGQGECKEERQVYGEKHSYFRIRMAPPQKLSYLNYLMYDTPMGNINLQ